MDPGIGFGKSCLAGTRIDVATVVGALAAGESSEGTCQPALPNAHDEVNHDISDHSASG